MNNEASIVGRMASPPCKVINPVPMPPVSAPCNIDSMDSRVNTEPDKNMRAMKSDKSFPDHVLPKGSTL
jgi:hypothetical protein